MIKIEDISILIVEDEFISLVYLSSILKSFGINSVFKASCTDEALEIVKNNNINLAFVDINIKGSIDGIKCASLINLEYFIPIIFQTAYKDTATINEAKNENIFGYLIKPFEASDVEATLNVAISSMNRLKNINNIKEDLEKKSIKLNLGEDFIYNFKEKTLTFRNNFIKLTKKESRVLDILCRNCNKAVSYENIKNIVWADTTISDTTVRDIVSRIKKKIPHINIKNISSFGYILEMIDKQNIL